MVHPRVLLLPVVLAALLGSLASTAQSVVSTHSGVLYFFDGSVLIGGQQVEQKFGRFPDIGEGGELRTERGRAEVLLTPGVFLRVGENSSIRMLSTGLSDTRVELLTGSAILEAGDAGALGTSVTLIHKNWLVQLPGEGVYQIDAEPARVLVYQGQAQVRVQDETDSVTVKRGETLPLAAVLVPEPQQSAPIPSDFKTWSMSRSEAVASDNAIAEGIIDDPSQIDDSGVGSGGFSYYPSIAVPYMPFGNPYGLSFWSTYQNGLSTLYLPQFLYRAYPGWPSASRFRVGRSLGTINRGGTIIPPRIGSGYRPVTPGVTAPRPMVTRPAAPSAAPRVGVRAGGHR